LRLLWRDGKRTAAAGQWQKKFRLIFVDEFQDINDAQDEIIRALGREGAEANRFFVGDVKQSIYRFRLADPGIFKRRKEEWEGGGGTALALNENFRSHERIIDFVNSIFTTLMKGEYDRNSRLEFGDRTNRAALTSMEDGAARVEIHLRRPVKGTNEDDDGANEVEREARLISWRLRGLKEAGTMIQTKEGARAVAWSDMALLLRSPRHKVEAYVKAFARLGIPLVAARRGFYDTMEARDLLNLLRILDNPLQDLPLLGALSSPFAGFTPRDLAMVRIGREKGRFWNALVEFQAAAGEKTSDLYQKTAAFLERFHSWRRQVRQSGVAACLERALDETHYTAWLGALERAPQRRANVEQFLQLTREFDAERGEGLHRFLGLVEAQQENEVEIEPGAAPVGDAVRLMSIHQSKGLEFPVVALGDLGKSFNLRDATGRVIVDGELGLCLQIKAPGSAQFYPSLANWLAQRRQKHETLNEEMRLLYVAMTRAKEWLILAGTASEKTVEEKWPRLAEALSQPDGILHGNNYLDWIGGWFAAQGNLAEAGGPKVVINQEDASADLATSEQASAEDISCEIVARLDWSYPFGPATKQAAKTSVSALRRQNGDEEEAAVWIARRSKGDLGASEIGSAHHLFLEAASLEKLGASNGVAEEAARLGKEGRLSGAQMASLDLEGLGAFWRSETGRELLAQKEFVRRELAFTARIGSHDQTLTHLGRKTGNQTLTYLDQSLGSEEFVVVQGVVDLAAILPEEIWIVDFKTDQFAAASLPDKIKQYRPQLELYGTALARIYCRPVTKSWLGFLSQRQVVLL